MKGNIYNSVFSTDPGSPWAIPRYTCLTGNCTWDPVASLAVRALCSNVTSSIKKTCDRLEKYGGQYDNCTVSLPNGISAYYSGGYSTEAIAFRVQSSSQPVVYTNATFPVIQRIEAVGANVPEELSIAMNIRDDPIYVATECSLEPIVRSVKTSVNSSVYKETTLAEWNEIEVWYDEHQDINGYSLLPNWNQSLGIHPGQNFTLSPESHATISLFMESLFSGKVQTGMLQLIFDTTADKNVSSYATGDFMEAFMYGDIPGCADNKNDRFGCVMRNVADAMSKSFRDQAYIDNGGEANLAVGHTQVNAIIIHVHWQWLTLPLLVWLLSAVT